MRFIQLISGILFGSLELAIWRRRSEGAVQSPKPREFGRPTSPKHASAYMNPVCSMKFSGPENVACSSPSPVQDPFLSTFLCDVLGSSVLPAPWSLCRDEHSGLFFWNQTSNETAWVRGPTCFLQVRVQLENVTSLRVCHLVRCTLSMQFFANAWRLSKPAFRCRRI